MYSNTPQKVNGDVEPNSNGSGESDLLLDQRHVDFPETHGKLHCKVCKPDKDESGAEDDGKNGTEHPRSLSPAHHKREDHTTTNLQTFIHLVKGTLGPGLLALPEAIKNGGLIVGVVGLAVIGFMATYCIIILVETAQELCKRQRLKALDYAGVAEYAVAEHTESSDLPKIASYVTNLFLLVVQLGACSIYFVFVGHNINQVMCRAFDLDFGAQAWIAILLVLVILLTWIRNLDELAIVSLIANLCILFSLAVITYEEIYQLVIQGPHDPSEIAAIRTSGAIDYWAYKTLPLYFGSVVFAIEAIGVVLPLENKMKTPQDYRMVVIVAMTLTTAMCLVFASLGYITYGNAVKGSITLNLFSLRTGACSVFLIVKMYFAFAILASIPLQFYVPMDFLEPPLLHCVRVDKLVYLFPQHDQKIKTIIQLFFRTVIVSFTAILAIVVPDLDNLISLVGAFSSCSLLLIFPPLLEILVFWSSPQHTCCGLGRWFWVMVGVLIMALGVVGMVFGTYVSITEIVKHYGSRSRSEGDCGLGNCYYQT